MARTNAASGIGDAVSDTYLTAITVHLENAVGIYLDKNLMTRSTYEREKYGLQVELLKFQAWVNETGQKVVLLFEGRDVAGKGGIIKRFIKHLELSPIDLASPDKRDDCHKAKEAMFFYTDTVRALKRDQVRLQEACAPQRSTLYPARPALSQQGHRPHRRHRFAHCRPRQLGVRARRETERADTLIT